MARNALRLAVLALGLFVSPPSTDAQAPPGHYMVSADTALDTQTGLVWQRGQVEQFNLGFASALQRCQQLSLGGIPAGGWRLANVRELLSIVDEREKQGPMWDRTVFNSTSLTAYWTSTDEAAAPANAWVFTFTPGIYMETREKATSSALVRCVH